MRFDVVNKVVVRDELAVVLSIPVIIFFTIGHIPCQETHTCSSCNIVVLTERLTQLRPTLSTYGYFV